MRLFGTDGIRGRAGSPPLQPETVARIGAALVRALTPTAGPSTLQAQGRPEQRRGATQPRSRPASLRTSHAPRVLIGRDTRESGTWIEAELARGLVSEGASVVSAGVVPTPAVAYLAGTEAFDVGIVISASHNPYEDNGIKVFSGSGVKVTEAVEREVERLVADTSWPGSTEVEESANAARVKIDPALDLFDHYLAHVKKLLPDAGPLRGWPIVIDCANGATAPHAPALFRSLGVDVTAIGATPDGRNINLDCGSTHLDLLARQVVERQARLGIAFDGDGDRTLLVDHRGQTVDGDAILLMAARHLQHEGRLPQSTIVATVMSNIGLEIALGELGITMVRCPVGDKFVMDEMSRRGLALGGEQSGHIILTEHLFTGDGMATALLVLRIVAESRLDLADLASAMVSYPQVLVNVRVREKADYMQVPAIAEAVRRVESKLAGHGRLLVRYSGTEPLLRIMLEGKDQDEIRAWSDEIAGAVKTHLG
jgi:phosphoglucosamine mutase